MAVGRLAVAVHPEGQQQGQGQQGDGKEGVPQHAVQVVAGCRGLDHWEGNQGSITTLSCLLGTHTPTET